MRLRCPNPECPHPEEAGPYIETEAVSWWDVEGTLEDDGSVTWKVDWGGYERLTDRAPDISTGRELLTCNECEGEYPASEWEKSTKDFVYQQEHGEPPPVPIEGQLTIHE